MKDYKNTLWRAARTFAQTALGTVAAVLTEALQGGEGITKTVLYGAIITAIATGIAALMNLPAKPTENDGGGDDEQQ